MRRRLVYPPYAWRLVHRAIVLWLLLRGLLLMLGLLLFREAGLIVPLLIAGIVSSVVAYLEDHDARVSHETRFYGNLGTPRALIVLVGLGTALLLEIGLLAIDQLSGGALAAFPPR